MINSKKVCLISLFMLCLMFATACSKPQEVDKPTANNVPDSENHGEGSGEQGKGLEEEEVEEQEEEKIERKKAPGVSVEEQVILDQDGVVITLKSLEYEGTYDPYLNVLVENNSDQAIQILIYDASINGIMVRGRFFAELGAGKKQNTTIGFFESQLKQLGMSTIKDIEFKFHVSEEGGWDDIFTSDIITITTTADPSYVQAYDDSGTVALDQDGIKIIITELRREENSMGEDIQIYVENNSEKDISISTKDVSINGFMMDTASLHDVLAGKKSMDHISFSESSLDENNITSVEEIDLGFRVSEASKWEPIIETPNVSVKFK